MIVVSGLPRSGTSMMMRMLSEGGLIPTSDDVRQPDESNPNGYYELEVIKDKDFTLDKYSTRNSDAFVVKVISAHLRRVLGEAEHKIVFMNRNLDEVMDSQLEMLKRRGKSVVDFNRSAMGETYRKHLNGIWDWIGDQENLECLVVGYDWVIQDPRSAADDIAQFIGRSLDTDKMARVVDPSLYRNRRDNE